MWFFKHSTSEGNRHRYQSSEDYCFRFVTLWLNARRKSPRSRKWNVPGDQQRAEHRHVNGLVYVSLRRGCRVPLFDGTVATVDEQSVSAHRCMSMALLGLWPGNTGVFSTTKMQFLGVRSDYTPKLKVVKPLGPNRSNGLLLAFIKEKDAFIVFKLETLYQAPEMSLECLLRKPRCSGNWQLKGCES